MGPGEWSATAIGKSDADDPCLTPLGRLVDTVVQTGSWSGDCDSANRVGSHARFYSFSLGQETEVRIDLTSGLDTVMFLLQGADKDGPVVAGNDDAKAGNPNSRIIITLQAGSYTVEATTYSARATGDFTLSLTPAEASARPPGPTRPCVDDLGQLQFDVHASGSWSEECSSNNREGSYAHFYTFSLLSTAMVDITLESDIDTYLYVMEEFGKDGGIVAANDDIDTGNTNSAVTATLDPGDYTMEATTYDEGQTGSFTLSINESDTIPDGDTCYLGQTLFPEGVCYYQDFFMKVDGAGDLRIEFTGDAAPPQGLSLVRSGDSWTIEELP